MESKKEAREGPQVALEEVEADMEELEESLALLLEVEEEEREEYWEEEELEDELQENRVGDVVLPG